MAFLAESSPSYGGDEPLEIEDFLALAETAGAATVTVTKQRRGYLHQGCILEFAEVTINRFAVHTVAVEGEDLDNVGTVARRLGIDQLPNQSYPQEIRRILNG
jgi:hypothetical protein